MNGETKEVDRQRGMRTVDIGERRKASEYIADYHGPSVIIRKNRE